MLLEVGKVFLQGTFSVLVVTVDHTGRSALDFLDELVEHRLSSGLVRRKRNTAL
jgi:hypothetical protein